MGTTLLKTGRIAAAFIVIATFGAATTASAAGQPGPAHNLATPVARVARPHTVGISENGDRQVSAGNVTNAVRGYSVRRHTDPAITVCGTGADYSTIQAAINAANPGDTIEICAGTFVEDVDVTVPVTLNGAGHGQTIIEPSNSAANPNGCSGSCIDGGNEVIRVGADNVTISNLTVNGDNPNLTGVQVNGVNVDARNGIITDFDLPNALTGLTITHVTVQNIFERGIEAGTIDGTYEFDHDTVTNVAGDPYGSIAMFAYESSGSFIDNTVSETTDAIHSNWTPTAGVVMTGNVVTHAGSGLETDNSGEFGTTDTISDNSVSNCNPGAYGITVFAPYSPVNVTDNSVSGCAIGLASFASNSDTNQNNTYVGPLVSYVGNTVDGQGVQDSIGALVTTDKSGFGCGPTNDQFTSNSIVNNTNSIYTDETNIFSYYGYADCALPGGLKLSADFNRLTGNTASGSGSGAFGNGSVGNGWYNDAQNAIGAANNWWGCNAGPVSTNCDAAGSGVTISPWLVESVSASPQHIGLSGTSTLTANLTMNSAGSDTSGTGYVPDGTPVSFHTDRGTLGTCSAGTTLGLATCTLTASNVPDTAHPSATTDNGSATTTVTWRPDIRICPGDFDTIQSGVNAANSGDTVTICAGTYSEQVVVSKNLTINGAGPSSTTLATPSSPTTASIAGASSPVYAMFEVTGGATVSLSGLTINGPTFNFPGGAGLSCAFDNYGVMVVGGATLNLSNATVTGGTDNPIDGCQHGVDILVGRAAWNAVGHASLNNVTVSNYQKGGIVDSNTGSTIAVSNTTVTGSGAMDQIAQNGIEIAFGAGGTVSNSTVTGNECSDTAGGCGPDPVTGVQATGMILYDAANGTTLTGNTVSGNDMGLYDSNYEGGTISASGNTISNNRYVGAEFDQGTTNFIGNTVSGSPYGLVAVSYDGNSGATNATVSSNLITGNGTGIYAVDQTPGASDISHVSAHYNRIVGNTTSGVSRNQSPTSTLDATNNWWGCNAGPNHAGCNGTTGSVSASPWLTLTLSAAQTQILPGGSTQLTASLTKNSAGTDTSSGGTVPNGTPVHIGVNPGDPASLASCQSVTTAGIATCNLNTTVYVHVPNMSHPMATVDNATATTSVTINLQPVIITYKGPMRIKRFSNVKLSAQLTTPSHAPISGRILKFSIGTNGDQQTCTTGKTSATGLASCVIGDVQARKGTKTVTINFAGDKPGSNYIYAASQATQTVTVFK